LAGAGAADLREEVLAGLAAFAAGFGVMADAPRFEGAVIVSVATAKAVTHSGKKRAFHLMNWTV